MGNVSAKDRVLEEAAGDGVDSAAAAAAGPAAEAVAIGTTNGSSVLQPFNGVADMISDGQLASANVNVVCRYRQISGQAAAAAGGGAGHGSSSLDNGDACIGPSVLSPMASPLSESSGMAANPPSIIAAQLPQVPVRWADELGQPWMHSSQSNDYESQTENMIATMIEWKHGGSDVSVEGSWDNWSSRIPLQRTGKGFTLVKFLPAGVYHYKFLVNGEQRHAPDLPHMYDEKGKGINIIDVQDYVPENLDGIAEFEAPGSPDSSYDSPFPGPEEYSKDPPLLPSQLHYNSELECLHQHPSSTVNSNSGSTNSSTRPQHVILNHLFVETRKAASSPVLTLGFTQRFRSKYVTVILHKPLKR